MEENKFNREQEGGPAPAETGTPEAAPQENIETPAPAARETAAQESRLPNDAQKSSLLPAIAGVAALLILGALAYYFLSGGGNPLTNTGNVDTGPASGAMGGAEENVSFELDSVVARVNGEELSGSDLAYQMIQAAQQAGVQDLSTVDSETLSQIREQSLDAIINTELLLQAAEEEGLSVSQEEVDAEYQSIVEGVGGQEVAKERFAALGITEDEFRANLADDLVILDYVETQGEADALAVSEEEIQAFYEQVSSSQEGEMPPLEEVQGQIEEQLQFQKEQEVLSSVLNELRQAANIEVLLGNSGSGSE